MLYIDGVQRASTSIADATSTSRTRARLRSVPGPSEVEAFPGSIDDVRLYNRVLTPAEVTQLYQQ